jgi:probable H4MPT-linked C1 transfer pathway protein
MTGAIVGWDVGGANIKAARLDERSAELVLLERYLPMWREVHRLPAVLAEMAATLRPAEAMAITMTAELADCFATKREGVAGVLDAFADAFPGTDPWVYGTDGEFRRPVDARRRPYRVAAANWMASASLASRAFPDALFVDVGSTTTDIIPIAGGRVVARGRTDPARLRTGELVYTGVLRTPVAAIVRTVPLRGRRCRVAAEYFACAADVHRWRGYVSEADYTCETPDGRGRSRAEAGARLARMVCADAHVIGDAAVDAIAGRVAAAQVRQVANGLRQVLRRLGPSAPGLAVLAGQGAFLARQAADAVGLATSDLADRMGRDAARSAPAAAVACLLRDFLKAGRSADNAPGASAAGAAPIR